MHPLALLVWVSLAGAEPPADDPSDAATTGEDATTSEGAAIEQPPVEAPSDPFADAGTSGGPGQPTAGGFGSVESVTTTSEVSDPQPPTPEPEPSGSRLELSARAEVGYGQVDLGNAEGLDHQGLAFRANMVAFPWFDKGHRFGVGLGLGYGYQGLNRKLAANDVLARSEGRQQQVHLTGDILVRPHPQMLSVQFSGVLGVAFYGFEDGQALLIADRPARVPSSERALVAGGALALCSVWDIVCVVGGAERIVDVYTLGVDEGGFSARVSPWGWRITLGFDVLRVFARANRIGR